MALTIEQILLAAHRLDVNVDITRTRFPLQHEEYWKVRFEVYDQDTQLVVRRDGQDILIVIREAWDLFIQRLGGGMPEALKLLESPPGEG
jgi:S-adenosylhomocysteine hydrolase